MLVYVPDRTFQPSLTRPEDYTRGEHVKAAALRKTLFLPADIRLNCECLLGAKTSLFGAFLNCEEKVFGLIHGSLLQNFMIL
jgi:hypothetical protein